MGGIRGKVPLWVANLFVFGFLFCAVIAYFLWQVQKAKEDFLAHVQEHAVMLAEVVQLSARGGVLSKQAAEGILEALLGNTARFVDHLDTVEPFMADELAAFSQEAGLAGIAIKRKRGTYVEGPPKWLPNQSLACAPVARLRHLSKDHLYLFSLTREGGEGCVMVGITDARIRSIEEHLGLDNVIRTLAGIPRMSYVKLQTPSPSREKGSDAPAVTMKDQDGLRVAEARVPMDGKEIAVALDAGYLDRAIERLWRDFFIFSIALASLGVVLSLILYQYQAAHLAQVKQFERQIALERESATLGRAAAAIAHEVRNPLNVLGMGLQRLQIEGDDISDDHRHLIDLMLDAVKRANRSVEGLLRYARPQRPLKKPIRLDRIVADMLHLYAPHCEALGITVLQQITCQKSISGDPGLLGQVVENLLKNAMEAQPDGGVIHVEVAREDQGVCLRVKNRGFLMETGEAERILEPYFTTKAEGTGLGLTLSRRIIEAHGGRITVRVSEPGTVEITAWLPIAGPGERTEERKKKRGRGLE